MSADVRIVHLADLHLGYSGPQTLVFRKDEPLAGRFVREVDIEAAVGDLTRRIVRLDPPVDVAVIAGDLFHRATPLPRPVHLAARMIRSLVGHGIEVVIVDGNHDSPAMRLHAGSPLDYLREVGAQVINGREYASLAQTLRRGRRRGSRAGWRSTVCHTRPCSPPTSRAWRRSLVA